MGIEEEAAIAHKSPISIDLKYFSKKNLVTPVYVLKTALIIPLIYIHYNNSEDRY